MLNINSFLKKYDLKETKVFYGHVVSLKEGILFIDDVSTGRRYSHIDESDKFVVEHINKKDKEYDSRLVASIIRKNNPNIRLSNSLIESCIKQVKSKEFSIDPAVLELREFNNNKADYILSDSSHIAVSMETQNTLNIILKEHEDIIDYMKINKNNFVNVVKKILEDKIWQS